MTRTLELTPSQRKLSEIGRYMMDCAVTEKCDVKSNELARVGNMLTRFGTAFGPSAKNLTTEDVKLISQYSHIVNL